MANVLVLVPSVKEYNSVKVRFTTMILSDKFNKHKITSNPEEADLILVPGSHRAYFEDLMGHEFTKKYREKIFMIHCGDRVIPLFPGIYTSIEKKWYSKNRVRSFGYYGLADHEYFYYDDDYSKIEYLFSFIGSSHTNSIRKKILSINHPDSYLFDTFKDDLRKLAIHKTESKVDYKKRYASIMRKSKFILCPRGFGTSSFRLFESMLFGRVPIIISDQWVPVEGPKWQNFSLRIKEKNWKQIPDALKELEPDAILMGKTARREWETWFSTKVIFHRIVELCLDIKRERKFQEKLYQFVPRVQLLRPFHLLRFSKKKIESLINKNEEEYEIIETK